MRRPSRSPLGLALGLAVLVGLSIACASGSPEPMTDFSALFPSSPTLPAAPTLALDDPAFNIPGPPFSVPSVPDSSLKPIVGPPPDWWYLVPIHPSASAAAAEGRSYHYLVPASPEAMTAFYEQAMRRGGWETFMDPVLSGSYGLLEYDRGDSYATIYISPHDGGSLVSIVIQ